MKTIVLPKQPDDTTQVVFNTRLGVNMHDCYFTKKAPWLNRWYEWQNIFEAAENNPALDDLLKKAEIVYALTK